MSDASTIQGEQMLSAKKLLWLARYERTGEPEDTDMARVTSLALSEAARRLQVEESTLKAWLARYRLDFKNTSTGPRIPLLTYPILKRLSEGASIEEARDSVADITARLRERP